MDVKCNKLAFTTGFLAQVYNLKPKLKLVPSCCYHMPALL